MLYIDDNVVIGKFPLTAGRFVRYAFRMAMMRVATAELAMTFRIWLTVIGQRRPDILRRLVIHKGETRDQAQVDFAKAELARELAGRLDRNQWHVMREELQQDRIWAAERGEPLDPPAE